MRLPSGPLSEETAAPPSESKATMSMKFSIHYAVKTMGFPSLESV